MQQLASRVSFGAEGKGFYPSAFCNSRKFDRFASKSWSAPGLELSLCYHSFPVVAACGGQQQGQNRDKFPESTYPTYLFFGIASLATVIRGSRPNPSSIDEPLSRPEAAKVAEP
jgi:hypothetical protein